MFRRGLECGRPGGKWRQATEAQQAEIAEFAQTVLDAREQCPTRPSRRCTSPDVPRHSLPLTRRSTWTWSAHMSTSDGRQEAISEIVCLAPELDGVVACAGIGGGTDTDSVLLVSINYFGAVELIEALRPAIRSVGAVVVLSSNSVTCSPFYPAYLARKLLGGDEQRAREAAARFHGSLSYPASKAALAWWVRRHVADWAADGIRLNAVAPGLMATPLVDERREDRM